MKRTELKLNDNPAPSARENHSSQLALRRLSYITAVIAVLLLSFRPEVGWTQAANTIVYDGSTTHCGDACCQEFTITINRATDTVDIVLLDNGGGGSDCFDHTCWSGQGTPPGETFEEGWSGPNDFRIVAHHSDPMWMGPFPITLNVYICGSSYDCFQPYDRWNWFTFAGASYETGYVEPLYETSCQEMPPCTSGCSYITVEPTGTETYYPESCGTNVCFYNQSGAAVTTFVLNFNPPLDPSSPCGIDGPVACSSFTNPSGCTCTPSYVHFSSYDAPTGNATFVGFNGGISNCSSACVYIPRCAGNTNPGAYETITLVSPTNPPTCNSDNTSIIVDLKKANGPTGMAASDSGGQNYPNPVEAATGFNTTIPFATSTGGVATIKIVNDKGVKVMTDDEEILGAGQHFFYFSAKDLSTGTYYYTIEFPQGVVIANKTILVVK